MGGIPIGDMSDDEVWQMFGIPTDTQEAEVEEAVTKALKVFEEHFNRTFERPVVVYDLKGHTAGIASIQKNCIRLNTELLYSHHDDMIHRTVPHEVAHIVQYVLYPNSRSHGGEWQYLMHILGLEADRTHSYKTTAARVRPRPYLYGCDCIGDNDHYVTITLHRRLQKGRVYTCRKCGGKLYFIREEA